MVALSELFHQRLLQLRLRISIGFLLHGTVNLRSDIATSLQIAQVFFYRAVAVFQAGEDFAEEQTLAFARRLEHLERTLLEGRYPCDSRTLAQAVLAAARELHLSLKDPRRGMTSTAIGPPVRENARTAHGQRPPTPLKVPATLPWDSQQTNRTEELQRLEFHRFHSIEHYGP